jgi:hypothetical protein
VAVKISLRVVRNANGWRPTVSEFSCTGPWERKTCRVSSDDVDHVHENMFFISHNLSLLALEN